jgi:predicted TIM-barrel fold metal-dependent hydrolase
MMPLAPQDVVAIDVHVHPQTEEFIAAMGPRAAQMSAYFGRPVRQPVSFAALADQYRERKMMAVLLNTTDVTTSGRDGVGNDSIGRAVRDHPDVFIGFGAIEPQLGELARIEIRRCAEELGLKGLGELNPGRQAFYPNDERYYPLWAEATRHNLVVLFHGGMMGAGAGTPGGMGYKLKYGRPIPYLDDIAADFPELKIIGAHPAWPWQEEALAIARHKTNFYIDLSGWAPRYFPPQLVQYAGSILQDRVLFGSDWPVMEVERWLTEFDELPIKPEVRPKIMLHNAQALLGLRVPQATTV